MVEDQRVLQKSSNEEHMEESDNNLEESIAEEEDEVLKPKRKPGIVYLSSIPIGMNPQLVRDFLGVYGEIGKSYLQPVNSK